MRTTFLDASIRRALVLGLAREPLDVPARFVREDELRSRLGYLAVLGQRARFVRPRPVGTLRAGVNTALAHADRCVDATTRVLLRRVLAGESRPPYELDVLALRIADALQAAGKLLHPFDRAALPCRRYFDAPAAAGPEEDPLEVWDELDPKERAAVLATLREHAPEQARERCVAEIGQLTAAQRRAWLEAFARNLSAEDIPFLESMLTDRAASVAQMADDLLARIPSTPRARARREEALGRLTKKRSGLARRLELRLNAPAAADARSHRDWVRVTFAGLAPRTLAEHFGIPLEKLPAALTDLDLCHQLWLSAIDQLDTEAAWLLGQVFTRDALQLVYLPALEAYPPRSGWSRAQRSLALATALNDACFENPLEGGDLALRLYRLLRAELTSEAAERRMAAASRWFSILEGHEDPGAAARSLLSWICVLPETAHGHVRAVADALPGPFRAPVQDLMLLLQRIAAP